LSMYLDQVISHKISLATQILPSFLPVVLV
jgi:hypothetical protein